jgi:hypothetical protein
MRLSVYRKTEVVYLTDIRNLSLKNESYAKRLRCKVVLFYIYREPVDVYLKSKQRIT